MFTATKAGSLLTTTTGALPRPSWYTENLRGKTLSEGLSRRAYREQHMDCLSCHITAQNRSGIDIFVDGDTRLDDDVAGKSWVSYALERILGVGVADVEVQPYAAMDNTGPGDFIWEVIETRLTPKIKHEIGASSMQLDRAWKAAASMSAKPLKVGSISAQVLAHMCINEYYDSRFELLMALSKSLNEEYHTLADAGAPIVQIEEPAIHQSLQGSNQEITPEKYVEAFNCEVAGLRDKCEVWAHTCWGSPGAQKMFPMDVSYKDALPFLDQLDIDVLTLEGASNGGLDFPLYGSMISKDKKVAVGFISHRTLQIERPHEVADLIRLCLKYIEPERLILSSDCGFGRHSMSRMHAFYKMISLVRGANIVRKELGLEEAYIPAADTKFSMVPIKK